MNFQNTVQCPSIDSLVPRLPSHKEYSGLIAEELCKWVSWMSGLLSIHSAWKPSIMCTIGFSPYGGGGGGGQISKYSEAMHQILGKIGTPWQYLRIGKELRFQIY